MADRYSREPIIDRLARAFTKNGDCWIWNGYKNPSGHAQMSYKGVRTGAHRLSYETFVGKIPEGLVLDHLCKQPSCINPNHLEPVTQGENVKRSDTNLVAKQMRRDNECKRGHKFTEENVYIRPSDPSIRECRTCRYDALRRFNLKKKMEMRHV